MDHLSVQDFCQLLYDIGINPMIKIHLVPVHPFNPVMCKYGNYSIPVSRNGSTNYLLDFVDGSHDCSFWEARSVAHLTLLGDDLLISFFYEFDKEI